MNIAIVTGASSGIGKGLAKKLDSLNLDEIWGIALEEELLEKTKGEMKTKFVPLTYDLTDEENLTKIKEKLESEKPNVRWLVNASGFGKFGRYDEIGTNNVMNMIDLNCKALVAITEYTLPYMSAGARIVNIGSVASFQPIPYINVYGATKAFVLSYSCALNEEVKGKQVSVTCVCPFWTKTAFFDRAEKKDNVVVSKYIALYETDYVVEKGFNAAVKRKGVYVVGKISKLQVAIVSLLPRKWVMKFWIKQQKLDEKYKDKKYL